MALDAARRRLGEHRLDRFAPRTTDHAQLRRALQEARQPKLWRCGRTWICAGVFIAGLGCRPPPERSASVSPPAVRLPSGPRLGPFVPAASRAGGALIVGVPHRIGEGIAQHFVDVEAALLERRSGIELRRSGATVATFDIERTESIAISPSRKRIAIPHTAGVDVIAVDDGAVLGRWPGTEPSFLDDHRLVVRKHRCDLALVDLDAPGRVPAPIGEPECGRILLHADPHEERLLVLGRSGLAEASLPGGDTRVVLRLSPRMSTSVFAVDDVASVACFGSTEGLWCWALTVPDARGERVMAEDVRAVAFEPDGRRAVVSTASRDVFVLDLETRELRGLPAKARPDTHPQFLGAGRVLVFTADHARVYDLDDDEELVVSAGPLDPRGHHSRGPIVDGVFAPIDPEARLVFRTTTRTEHKRAHPQHDLYELERPVAAK